MEACPWRITEFRAERKEEGKTEAMEAEAVMIQAASSVILWLIFIAYFLRAR
jgi:hypothetical protein